jgi:murein DD-endopeptidase MepM/ murein hydrolase activator NlpD
MFTYAVFYCRVCCVGVGRFMRALFGKIRSFPAFRWGTLSVVAIGVVGCSSDATRFGDNPTASPYASRAPSDQVSAVPQQPVAGVERQPAPPPRNAPEITGTVRPGSTGHWVWEGGTAVVIGPDETIETVARKHGVPVQALMQANAITNPASVVPGQRLVIPRYAVHGTGANLAHAAAPRGPAPAAAAVTAVAPGAALPASAPTGSVQTLLPVPPVHTVAAGDTLSRIARQYRVKVKDLTIANGIQPDTRLNIGMKLTVPVTAVAAAPKGQPAAPPVKAQSVAQAKSGGVPAGGPAKPQQGAHAPSAPVPGKMASSDPPPSARVATAVDVPADDAGSPGLNGAPAFRWPVRGRVINNFGAKINGAANDGIDLAVPDGTPVRAADDGVVAYSGNELKGYGNLVLVRHANGFVTAYAHASELMVKRNDQVHKGQVIAKSGQTGTAANPQLHFEVRKNSAPVDPMQYLPADKTASAPL